LAVECRFWAITWEGSWHAKRNRVLRLRRRRKESPHTMQTRPRPSTLIIQGWGNRPSWVTIKCFFWVCIHCDLQVQHNAIETTDFRHVIFIVDRNSVAESILFSGRIFSLGYCRRLVKRPVSSTSLYLRQHLYSRLLITMIAAGCVLKPILPVPAASVASKFSTRILGLLVM